MTRRRVTRHLSNLTLVECRVTRRWSQGLEKKKLRHYVIITLAVTIRQLLRKETVSVPMAHGRWTQSRQKCTLAVNVLSDETSARLIKATTKPNRTLKEVCLFLARLV